MKKKIKILAAIVLAIAATHALDYLSYRPRAITCRSTVGWNLQSLQLNSGLNVVNPGAGLTIIEAETEAALKAFVSDDSKSVYDGFYLPDDTTIVVLGPWTRASETVLHEYEHYLEHTMPDQAARLRAAFLALETPAFKIGYADLENGNGLPSTH